MVASSVGSVVGSTVGSTVGSMVGSTVGFAQMFRDNPAGALEPFNAAATCEHHEAHGH